MWKKSYSNLTTASTDFSIKQMIDNSPKLMRPLNLKRILLECEVPIETANVIIDKFIKDGEK